MAYLNCPSCRLTVYKPAPVLQSEDCPRCSAKLGTVGSLFRSSLPARFAKSRKRDDQEPPRPLSSAAL